MASDLLTGFRKLVGKTTFNKQQTQASQRDRVRKDGGVTPQQQKLQDSKNAAHPLKNAENHRALLEYIKDRLEMARQPRDILYNRFQEIDKKLAGFIKLDADDMKRAQDNKTGGAPKPVSTNLPITSSQLDEVATYLMTVYAPDGQFFKAVSTADKQQIANGFTNKMNQDADKAQYYREYVKFINSCLKYNLGWMYIYWDQVMGNKIENDQATGNVNPKLTKAVVFEGNAVKALDVYNTLFDPSVHPVDLPTMGEFFATIDPLTRFRIERLRDDGKIYNTEKFIDNGAPELRYWKSHPQVFTDVQGDNTTGMQTDWVSFFTQGNTKATMSVYEIVTWIGWIIPSQFGLSSATEMQIWRIAMANGTAIVSDEFFGNAHGMLPIVAASPNEENLGLQTKSAAEQLLPMQDFASFLYNAHVEGTRKALYGLTIYDQNVIPLNDKNPGVAGQIAARPNGTDNDLRKSILQLNLAPDTSGTLIDIDKVMGIMQKILPTDLLKQVTDLERATEYQAAATVQAGNRRNLKNAKMIDDQAFKNLRMMLMFNLLERAKQIDLRDPQTGKTTATSITNFRDADLEFDMADGLKAIDKMFIISMLKEIINICIQSQQIMTEYDIGLLINYWTQMMGDKLDITQFKRTLPEQGRMAGLMNPAGLAKVASVANPNGTSLADTLGGTQNPNAAAGQAGAPQ